MVFSRIKRVLILGTGVLLGFLLVAPAYAKSVVPVDIDMSPVVKISSDKQVYHAGDAIILTVTMDCTGGSYPPVRLFEDLSKSIRLTISLWDPLSSENRSITDRFDSGKTLAPLRAGETTNEKYTEIREKSLITKTIVGHLIRSKNMLEIAFDGFGKSVIDLPRKREAWTITVHHFPIWAAPLDSLEAYSMATIYFEPSQE